MLGFSDPAFAQNTAPSWFDTFIADPSASATMLSAGVGFIGIVAALLFNGWLSVRAQKAQWESQRLHWEQEDDRQAVKSDKERLALISAFGAELNAARNAINDYMETTVNSEFLERFDGVEAIEIELGWKWAPVVYPANADKIGLLGPRLATDIVEIYDIISNPKPETIMVVSPDQYSKMTKNIVFSPDQYFAKITKMADIATTKLDLVFDSLVEELG